MWLSQTLTRCWNLGRKGNPYVYTPPAVNLGVFSGIAFLLNAIVSSMKNRESTICINLSKVKPDHDIYEEGLHEDITGVPSVNHSVHTPKAPVPLCATPSSPECGTWISE